MATRTRSRSRGRTRSRSTGGVGRLFLAALLSWIAFVLLDRLTVAPDGLAMWASGAVAALTLTVRTGRR